MHPIAIGVLFALQCFHVLLLALLATLFVLAAFAVARG
jgi:hypothetical protein